MYKQVFEVQKNIFIVNGSKLQCHANMLTKLTTIQAYHSDLG